MQQETNERRYTPILNPSDLIRTSDQSHLQLIIHAEKSVNKIIKLNRDLLKLREILSDPATSPLRRLLTQARINNNRNQHRKLMSW